jgi:hypothetical protein
MAGLLVSLAFAVGLFTIWIGPETRGWSLSDAETEPLRQEEVRSQ